MTTYEPIINLLIQVPLVGIFILFICSFWSGLDSVNFQYYYVENDNGFAVAIRKLVGVISPI